MRLVIIESPYAGDIELNLRYARACMVHSISLGEAPFASHLLYPHPDVLDDRIDTERALGIALGYAWGLKADTVVFYNDLGFSPGMEAAWDYYCRYNTRTGKAIKPYVCQRSISSWKQQ